MTVASFQVPHGESRLPKHHWTLPNVAQGTQLPPEGNRGLDVVCLSCVQACGGTPESYVEQFHYLRA